MLGRMQYCTYIVNIPLPSKFIFFHLVCNVAYLQYKWFDSTGFLLIHFFLNYIGKIFYFVYGTDENDI